MTSAAGTLLAVALPLAASSLALAALLGRGRGPDRLLAVSLSLGGLGLASLPVFAWCLAGGRLAGAFLAADLALSAALTAAAAWLARRAPAAASAPTPAASGAVGRVGLAALAAVVAAALWNSALQAERLPHGRWDAWAIWNLRARTLYRVADGRAALAADPPRSHFEYPLLLPASVARLWVYAGEETTGAPTLLAFLFTFGAAALCGAALWRFRGAGVALAGTALVLASSDFLVYGQSQCADVPVGYYLLAAVVLAAWHDEGGREGGRPRALVLAGLAAGLGAWTKNEGLLFALALLAARAALALRRRDRARLRTEMAWLGAGLALPLAAVALYKVATPHQSWLLDTRSGPLAGRILDPSRFRIVLEEFGRHLFGFGWGSALAVSAVAWLLSRAGPAPAPRPRWPLGVVGLVLLGYAAVFLATPFDVRWHLGMTVPRLISQIWPASVFALLYAAAPAAPAPAPSPAGAGSPP